MIDIALILQLWFRSISSKKGSLRRLSGKRLVVVLFVIPLIIFHVLLTHLFLKLDDLLFPGYRSKDAENAVFIVGVPRSGTTFLLNLIANNREAFTSFELWEMVFAPSIIQKLFYGTLNRFLIKIKVPTEKIIAKLDQLLFGKMKDIHGLKLQAFEEDELLFMYLFQSAYLIFIFPGLEDFHQLLEPDNPGNLSKRVKSMRFYKSLVKRHLYVFDKENEKQFLSKNPMHVMRLESLTTVFPDSKYLLIQRPLEKTIPSTMSLNEHLYRYFCTKKIQSPLRTETIEILLKWHRFLNDFKERSSWSFFPVYFKNLIHLPSKEAMKIHDWLDLPINSKYASFLNEQDEFSKEYKSKHRYQKLSVEELKTLEKGNPFSRR